MVLLVAVAAIVAIVVASFAFLYPYLETNYFGPAPLYHSFDGVFTNSGQLAIESCSLGDTQPVLQGVGGVGRPVAFSVISCAFHSASYVGFYGINCNLNPSTQAPVVNGSQVPYDGCVLGRAPLNYTFTGVFSMAGASHNATDIYNAGKSIANITLTDSWRSFGCWMPVNNVTRTDGPVSCLYEGVEYVGFSVIQRCNVVASVEAGGSSIPPGSCNLERSDDGTA
jgi:hypothetical protein